MKQDEEKAWKYVYDSTMKTIYYSQLFSYANRIHFKWREQQLFEYVIQMYLIDKAFCKNNSTNYVSLVFLATTRNKRFLIS